MKRRIIFLGKLTLLVAVTIIYISCASTPKSASAEFTGVWKLQEAYTNDYTTPNNYLVINSNDTIEVWSDNGLTVQAVLELDTEGRMRQLYTQTPENSSIEGSWNFVEFDRQEDLLREVLYPEDLSWKWDGFLDRVDKLPVFTYKNNFEDNSLEHFLPQQFEDKEEWQIIEEPGNPENKMLAPLYADQNSDAEIFVYTGKNFSIEFDYKQTKTSDTDENCWMALDFFPYANPGNNYNPFWLYSDVPGSFSSGDRGEDYVEQSYNVEGIEWDIWHTLKVTVREGKYFQFYLDGDLFGEREVEETLFTGFKIEGNPENGRWIMDNLNITWNETN